MRIQRERYEARNIPHDLFLQSSLSDESVHIHNLLLSNSMRPIHSLQIFHGIPIMLDENDSVGTRQCQPQSSNVRREEQTIDTRIRVERLHDCVPLARVRTTVETHVRHGRHVRSEEVRLDDVQHLLHLAEDQHAVLREGAPARRRLGVREFALQGVSRRAWRTADTAVNEQLSARGQQ